MKKLKTKKIFSKKRLPSLLTVLIVIAGLVTLAVTYAPEIKAMLPVLAQKAPFLSKVVKAPKPAAPEVPEAAPEELKIVPVSVYRVARGDFEDILPAMGTIKGQKDVELRFEINGIIDSINFREADVVKKGDVVATLNQKDALLKLEYSQSKLNTAQTQALTAEKKLEIYQRLYQIGAIIKPKLEEVTLEYESAKSQVVSAEKEVEFAKAELEKTYLTAPLDGVMGTKDAEEGEFVTSNMKVASLIDIETVFAEVGVIEKELQKIALGQEAEVWVDAYPGVEFKGIIDNILPTIEGKSRTLTCKLKLDNPEGQLLPGMFARAQVSVFKQKGVLTVPNTCLLDQDGDGIFDSTFVVSLEENIANLRSLSVGYSTSDYAVINTGLEEGELVVAEARGELSDGTMVEILETQGAPGLEPVVEEEEGLLVR